MVKGLKDPEFSPFELCGSNFSLPAMDNKSLGVAAFCKLRLPPGFLNVNFLEENVGLKLNVHV